jgi:hypothetical protein
MVCAALRQWLYGVMLLSLRPHRNWGGGVLIGGFCICSEDLGSSTYDLLKMLIVIIGMQRNFFLR